MRTRGSFFTGRKHQAASAIDAYEIVSLPCHTLWNVNDYHRMSIQQKQAYAMRTAREPAVTCPACDTQTPASDLLEHMQSRCRGRREPHPAAVWVTWATALKLGVHKVALSRSVARGQVRMRGERLDREYLLRDVVALVAARRMRPCKVEIMRGRRRKFHK